MYLQALFLVAGVGVPWISLHVGLKNIFGRGLGLVIQSGIFGSNL